MTTSSGVTILELIVGLAVFAVLGGMAALTFDNSRIATNQAATRLANDVSRTRFEAIKSNASALIVFDDTAPGSYSVCLDRDNDTACDDAIQTVAFGQDEYGKVVLSAATVRFLGFDRRGLPIGTGGSVTVENSAGTHARTVTFTPAGNVEVQ